MPLPPRPNPPNHTPSSPCVRNCCLDEADVCLGCGRTLDEIRDWHGASAEQRAAILTMAAQRLASRERR